jgi:hypothetical protein
MTLNKRRSQIAHMSSYPCHKTTKITITRKNHKTEPHQSEKKIKNQIPHTSISRKGVAIGIRSVAKEMQI